MPRWGQKKDTKGIIFGRLLCLGKAERRGLHTYELCKCMECGREHYVDRCNMLSGNAGCRWCSHLKHGLSRNRIARIFIGIKQRCNNKKYPEYHNYGGRGIVCERKTSTEFINDMYDSYLQHVREYGEEETTIERIDVNGNYCKENCRWATQEEQANNQRRTTGVTKFAREYGIGYNKVRYRYDKGLTFEEILKKFYHVY